MWWVSGLDCHLILDGHARLAAAIAASIEPPLLQLHRTMPRDDLAARIDDAVGFYEHELERFAELRAVHGPTVPDGAATAGPELVRLLHDRPGLAPYLSPPAVTSGRTLEAWSRRRHAQ